ncbi:MAG: undecaprenyl-diphosphate phosphatase [Caulobacter sp.]|nr:undecaprenyl-diphosphate phosphatase [Caulobacter sp.]
MPDWLSAIILGLVEGLTEFIPVSSTGHLLLANRVLGLEDGFWDTFAVMIQLGAILAVVVLYFQRLWKVLIGLPSRPEDRRFVLSVLIAFLPAVVLGLAFHDFIKQVLFDPMIVCWSLVVGGVVLLVIDRWRPEPRFPDAMKTPLWTALGVGLLQCLAMIPGVSRSGATIVGGMLMRMEKRAAAEFSFFLAIPTMVGAFALDLIKSRDQIFAHADGLGVIAIGFVVSFLAGAVVIKLMLGFIDRYGLAPFGVWRIIVGAAGLALLTLT